MPTVSIILSAYNGEQFIGEAIESVLCQSFSNWELICVDDGSNDRTGDLIHSYTDKRIRYFFQQNSGSPARGRNFGINICEGDYIAFIDQDDIYLPDSISERLNCFIENPELYFLYSDCAVIDHAGKVVSDSIIKYTNKQPFSGNCFKELFCGIFIPIQGVMVRKCVFDKIGVFNESLVGTEDYEMWLRIAYSYPLFFLGKTLAKWREHPPSLSQDRLQMDINFFNCLESILNKYSDASDLIGEQNVRKRMYEFSNDVAYEYIRRSEIEYARHWLKIAWFWGRRPKILLKLMSSFVPGTISYMRNH